MTVAQTGAATVLLRSLLLPLVFLAPGVPALRLKRWAARRSGRPPRFQLAVYGTLLAATSLLTLYLGVSWFEWRPIGTSWIDDLSLYQQILLFVLHFALTLVYGALFGEVKYNYYTGNKPRDLYDSWDYAFEHVFQSGDVILKTTSGTWVHGEVVQSGSSDETRDLLFESARVLDPRETSELSVTPHGETAPQIQHGDENSVLRDSTASFSDMDELLSEDQSETATADNYIYVDKSTVETVIFCGGTEMEPAAEIEAGTPGAVEELLSELFGEVPRVPDSLESTLRAYRLPLLGVVVALVAASLSVFSGWLVLPDRGETYLSCVIGVVTASTTTVYYRTGVLRRPKCVLNVDVGGHETLYGFLAVVAVWSYAPVLSPAVVPLLVGVVVGTTLTTVHLGLLGRFDTRAASCSSVLASIPIVVAVVWVERGVTSLFGRTTTLFWAIIAVVLIVDRIRIGTPSSYNEWSDVARYVVWWVITVAICIALVAVAFGVSVPATTIVTGVLLLVGWLLARSLRRTVRSDVS